MDHVSKIIKLFQFEFGIDFATKLTNNMWPVSVILLIIILYYYIVL